MIREGSKEGAREKKKEVNVVFGGGEDAFPTAGG